MKNKNLSKIQNLIEEIKDNYQEIDDITKEMKRENLELVNTIFNKSGLTEDIFEKVDYMIDIVDTFDNIMVVKPGVYNVFIDNNLYHISKEGMIEVRNLETVKNIQIEDDLSDEETLEIMRYYLQNN